MKDVIVTGGRDYSDANMVEDVLDLFDIGLLIQGGASGADRLAEMYADAHSIESVTIEADWDKHGRAAGPIRNKEMLKRYPNAIVIAFPGGAGTQNCIKTAISLNMIVLEVK
jgi:hypothetical protein